MSDALSDAQPVAIRVENVTKTFARAQGQLLLRDRLLGLLRRDRHRFPALDNVSFSVRRGESLGLIGHNGAGKSTLLALIAGLAKPDRGTIEVQGRIAPLLELGAGFHPDLSGLENMRLNASLLGLTRSETARRLPEMVEFSGVEEFINSPTRTYSAGMIMRIAFSVAACVQPDVVLIDEVLAVGDQEFVQRCYARLRKYREMGHTIVVVSHSMQSVLDLCDSALWTDHGRVKMHGPAREVVAAYEASLDKAVEGPG